MADGNLAPTPTEDAKAAAEAKAAAKKARAAARKELKSMHLVKDKSARNASFDAKRYHELHYLAAGKPVPERDDD